MAHNDWWLLARMRLRPKSVLGWGCNGGRVALLVLKGGRCRESAGRPGWLGKTGRPRRRIPPATAGSAGGSGSPSRADPCTPTAGLQTTRFWRGFASAHPAGFLIEYPSRSVCPGEQGFRRRLRRNDRIWRSGSRSSAVVFPASGGPTRQQPRPSVTLAPQTGRRSRFQPSSAPPLLRDLLWSAPDALKTRWRTGRDSNPR